MTLAYEKYCSILLPTVATANSEDTFASEDQPSKLGM